MKGKTIPKKMTKKQRQELETLKSLPDGAIDLSDIPEITDWSGAVRGRFYRPVKKSLTIGRRA